ncbi:MAG: hypothetical protein NTX98_01740, partial [Candidatus Doudnabacteria bacterium]|nr:hypothetical protein [Candidatus Doudnabacteria bacterium]
MKKILKQKINLNNQALIGGVALVLAFSLFAFWRIFLQINGNIRNQKIPISESIQTTAENSPKTFVKIPVLIYHHIGDLPIEA